MHGCVCAVLSFCFQLRLLASQAASQQMMALFDGQMLSLAEALEVRLAQRADAALQSSLAQMAAGKALVPLEEAGQAAVRAQRGPRGTDGTAPY